MEFRERCRSAAPEKRTLPIFEQFRWGPDGRRMALCRDLRTTKLMKVHRHAFEITLTTGEQVWVDQVDMQRNLLGLIEGLPGRGAVDGIIDKAKEFVRRNFYGPEPVVIPPKLFDAESVEPIMPPLRFAAQVRSWAKVNDEDEGSWLNLIWFAETDDEKSIKDFVREALRQLDWKMQASGYSI
jgi:hypothetical protein